MRFNRRNFLKGLGALSLPVWFPRVSFAGGRVSATAAKETLVCIFLRGGADSLNMVIPYSEKLYYDNRPTLAIAAPGGSGVTALELDSQFGLHPSMAPLLGMYQDGMFAPVVATGLKHDTHSHFDAMIMMEGGVTNPANAATGWLNRHLALKKAVSISPFRAIALSESLPGSLMGDVPVTALNSLEDFSLSAWDVTGDNYTSSLEDLFQGETILDKQGQQLFEAIKLLNSSGATNQKPANGARYLEDFYFSNALKEIASLIKADLGLEIACTDFHDWDTHEGQGGTQGWMPDQLAQLSLSLEAFITDLGALFKNVTIMIMSEFGRRVDENGSYGTDHGHGGMMMVLGGNIKGGSIYGDWPGLSAKQLYGPGDLQITTDYRTVLGEILAKKLGNKKLKKVFPDYQKEPYLGLF